MTAQCPYPPRILVSDEFLVHLDKQLLSIRYRYALDPEYPGWTFRDPDHTKRDKRVLRYDDTGGNWWLWFITEEVAANNCYVAKWMD